MLVELSIIIEHQNVDRSIISAVGRTERLEEVVTVAKDLTSELLWAAEPANRAIDEESLEVGAGRKYG